MRKISYKVEKSHFPEDNKTHLVVRYIESDMGFGCGRIFKGTFRECHNYKRKLENEHKLKQSIT